MKRVKLEKVQSLGGKKIKRKTSDNHERDKKESEEEEEPNIFPPQSTTVRINPMLMDDIVAQVFEFLDLETLKSIRSVSQLWRKEGGKEMLRKSYIRLPPIFQMTEDEDDDDKKHVVLKNEKRKKYVDTLAGLISSLGNFQQVAVHIPKTKNFPDESKILFRKSIGLQEKCGELKYTKIDSIGLFHILEKLPHISKLTTHDLNAPLVNITSDNTFWTEDKQKSFRDKLNALTEIKYNLGLYSPSLAYFTKCADQYGELKITGLKVSGRKSDEPVTKDVLISFMNTIINNPNAHKNWQLKELDITIDTTIAVELYHEFFHSLTPSSSTLPILKTLRVNVTGAWDVVRRFTPWETKWHLPITSKRDLSSSSFSSSLTPSPLDRLTSLCIECPANKLWPIFTIAFQLPCLKTLVLKSDKEAGYRFDRKVKEWNEDGNGVHRLESKSLEVVDLSNCPYFHLRTMDHAWWPNLKCLKIQLQQNQVFPPYGLSHFFKGLSKVQSLERLGFVLVQDVKTGKRGYWDAILCGRMRTNQDEESIEEQKLRAKEFSLENLKFLKSLSLDSRCEPAHDVSDFLIQNALVHLNQLQSIVIHGHKFNKPSQLKLRQSLGPYAAIHLYK